MTPHPALSRQPRELVQLAGEWRGGVPDGGTWVEEKLDGVRACYVAGRLLTREGVEIGGVGHILHRIGGMERAAGVSLFIDGEFMVAGDYLRTLSHIGHGAGAREQGTFHLFDCLTEAEWRANDCDRPLYQRKAMLAGLVEAEAAGPVSWEWREGTHGREPEEAALSLVPDIWCATQADVEAEAARIWARGGEGVMVKDAEAPYRRLRTNAWMKYKRNGWATRKVA
ncbi:MAG: hypothetical protein DI547_05070 [Sphingobium sp.]|nr:MAG: hypothetical protein DI547_05070 [Sphingobium sp.]